ncbi:hypothetical protein PtB15_6B543 [Puccinia triticina]|nr:hypothetical protein PtB15_6B543 [Puccinia triticina]
MTSNRACADLQHHSLSPTDTHISPAPTLSKLNPSTNHPQLSHNIAKIQSGQNPADEPSSSPPTGQTTALSTPTTSADSTTRQLKQQPTNTAVASQSHSTTIIFNQSSWVTADDQPVQTPRYIPYIEFDNYSTYGNLIFDLNTGLSRTARVDCKPDGLEKAPPEALEEHFEAHGESSNEPSPDQRLKIKIIPPQSASSNPPIETASTSTSSHFNRPPSSLAGGISNHNRPPSAFSCAAQSEDNRSASASEAHSLEPWAVPRSGRFWGHDDRQSYHHRRGGRGFLAKQTGNAGGPSRGTLRNRGGFRADWPANSPSSRKSQQGSIHRPETPAGQSDTGRSVASAGWITVPSKPKPFLNGFQHPHFHKSHPADQADGGEWRHDGWEEIEREADRKLYFSNRGRGGFNHSRGAPGWRGGAPSSSGQLRRPTTNLAATSEIPSVNGKADVGPEKSSSVSASTSTPRGKESDEAPSSTPTNEPSRANTRDGKLVNGDQHVLEAAAAEKTAIVDTTTRANPSPSLSRSATPSSQAQPVLVQLPKTIKIGTIPVYPPATLQSHAAEKSEVVAKSQAPPSPVVDPSSSRVPSLGQSPSTPDLSDTPQVSRSASTLEDHPSQKSDPVLTPLSIAEPSASGPITLGSAGGAEVLREAMSTPKVLMPSYPLPPHEAMIPMSHPSRNINSQQQHDSHSRTSSMNSHPGNFYHQPSLGPIPPLQYFDSHSHNVVYPHPPSFGPPSHQPFEPSPPPALPPPPPPSTSPGMSAAPLLPGHFAPPKSTKVRISHPGKAGQPAGAGGDSTLSFGPPAPASKPPPSDPPSLLTLSGDGHQQLKTTEAGISYYEFNGPPSLPDHAPSDIHHLHHHHHHPLLASDSPHLAPLPGPIPTGGQVVLSQVIRPPLGIPFG